MLHSNLKQWLAKHLSQVGLYRFLMNHIAPDSIAFLDILPLFFGDPVVSASMVSADTHSQSLTFSIDTVAVLKYLW